jgi:hypothetical protein
MTGFNSISAWKFGVERKSSNLPYIFFQREIKEN